MTRSRSLLTLVLPLLLLFTASACELVGDDDDDSDPQGTLTTVEAVLDNPQDDQRVALSGSIGEQISRDTFDFSDDTGQIRIDLDDDILDRQEITPGMQVGIEGEVDVDAQQEPEIDVDRLTVADAGSNP